MRYRRKDNVVKREIAGETLLIPITQVGANLQKVFLLNETALAVWDLLGEWKPLDALVAEVAETYDAPEETLRADIAALLTELQEHGLVEEATE